MGRHGLGDLELLVILAILRLDEDEAYSVSIVDEIRARTGRSLQRATVYVVLQRLEEKGLVSTWLGEGRPTRGGKARRLVRVEPEGLRAAREAQGALRNMWDVLERA